MLLFLNVCKNDIDWFNNKLYIERIFCANIMLNLVLFLLFQIKHTKNQTNHLKKKVSILQVLHNI